MIIELPGFDFEKPHPNGAAIEPAFDKIRQFLDTKGVNSKEYTLGSEPTAGFGELVIHKVNDFWVVCTTEHGTNFDVAIFSSDFHAVYYFIFRLTGNKDTINWSSI